MSKEVTIWVVIGVYAILMLGIGVWYSRKGADMSGFTVGGRNAGAWISALSYGTAYFSAVMFIGYSGGSGWNYGLWSTLVGLGNAIFGTLLAWLVLANRTRALTRRHDIKSMPQMFERRFHSAGMRLFSCVVIFLFLIPYSASVYKGLTSVCSVILGIDEQVCMIIIAIASALVLVLGGYMATLKADFVQGLIMMVGVAALIVLVVQSQQVGGLGEGIARMTEYMRTHEMAPLSGSATMALVSTILMTPADDTQILRNSRQAGSKTRCHHFHLFLATGCWRRIFYRFLFAPVFWRNTARWRYGLCGSSHVRFRRTPEPADWCDPGAAHFSLGIYPFQHYAYSLFDSLNGSGEDKHC